MKDIKDYLHLYLMCKYQWKDGDGEWRRPDILTAYQLNSIRQSGVEARLILRPLSDMTEEEGTEWFKARYNNEFTEVQIETFDTVAVSVNVRLKGRKNFSVFSLHGGHTPEQFTYLLSKGFDLFGLIPDGLAIDATTLKKTV